MRSRLRRVHPELESDNPQIGLQADAIPTLRRYGRLVSRFVLAQRWRSVQPLVDWFVAAALAAMGLADAIRTHYATPEWAAVLLVLFLFLPLGVRRRYPVAVFALVITCSLVLKIALGHPADATHYGLEVFLAWLIAGYSVGAYAEGRPYRYAIVFGLAATAVWWIWSYANGVGDQNTLPSTLFTAVAWVAGRAMRRRQQTISVLGDRAAQLEREREERVRQLVTEERARIARELHDVVAHSVSVMVVQAQAGPRLLAEPEQAAGAFTSIEASGREALVELRRLLGILRTDKDLSIGPQPGLSSLQGLVEQVRDADVPVTLRVEGDAIPLPPGLDLSAYRIVQEALTNTIKHAGPARADVTIRYGASAIEVEIVDDGRGESQSVNGSGHGLIGMRERAALYGGELEAGPRPGGGYAVRARLPVGGSR
jgi:signal transduction histidine kinase